MINRFEEEFETLGLNQLRALLATAVFAIVTANLAVLVSPFSNTPLALLPVLVVSAVAGSIVYRLL